jgi:cytochrome c peroxidase
MSIGIVLLILLTQCSSKQGPTPYVYNLNKGWEEPTIPDNNPLTLESIELGRNLFFDTTLSVDSSISCSSCHIADFGFADRIPFSVGVGGQLGFRNSGTLTNVAYLPYFNRDGGVKTLDIFASVPIEDHQEMGFNMLLAGQRLGSNYKYAKAAKEVYGRDFDGFVITRALSSFLRTFISDNSLYDKVLNEENGAHLNQSQKKGKSLFFGDKANCSKCHSGIQFTDYTFQNNGLLDSYANKDRGRERITLNTVDEGKFRVATLRNIEVSAPYMHDGSLPTLESVLQHYSSKGSQHKNKNPLIDEIELSSEDEKNIIDFLKTLTDKEFINNPAFSRPFID